MLRLAHCTGDHFIRKVMRWLPTAFLQVITLAEGREGEGVEEDRGREQEAGEEETATRNKTDRD